MRFGILGDVRVESYGKENLLGSGQEVHFDACDQYKLMVEA